MKKKSLSDVSSLTFSIAVDKDKLLKKRYGMWFSIWERSSRGASYNKLTLVGR